MRSKEFFRGLGVGIIITALLLCIYYRKEMSDNAIISKARIMGMDFISNDEKSKNQKTKEAVSQGAINPTIKPIEKPTAIPTNQSVALKPTNQPTVKPTFQPTVKPIIQSTKKLPTKNTSKYTSFTIKPGLLSDTIASQMEKAGIVEDGKKFDQYLVKNGYSEKIKCGNFKIPKKSSYAKIAKIIAS